MLSQPTIGVRHSFARDASGLEMIPDAVARPATERDVVDAAARVRERTAGP